MPQTRTDYDDLITAIAILSTARRAAHADPLPIWTMLAHACRRLEAQLTAAMGRA